MAPPAGTSLVAPSTKPDLKDFSFTPPDKIDLTSFRGWRDLISHYVRAIKSLYVFRPDPVVVHGFKEHADLQERLARVDSALNESTGCTLLKGIIANCIRKELGGLPTAITNYRDKMKELTGKNPEELTEADRPTISALSKDQRRELKQLEEEVSAERTNINNLHGKINRLTASLARIEATDSGIGECLKGAGPDLRYKLLRRYDIFFYSKANDIKERSTERGASVDAIISEIDTFQEGLQHSLTRLQETQTVEHESLEGGRASILKVFTSIRNLQALERAIVGLPEDNSLRASLDAGQINAIQEALNLVKAGDPADWLLASAQAEGIISPDTAQEKILLFGLVQDQLASLTDELKGLNDQRITRMLGQLSPELSKTMKTLISDTPPKMDKITDLGNAFSRMHSEILRIKKANSNIYDQTLTTLQNQLKKAIKRALPSQTTN